MTYSLATICRNGKPAATIEVRGRYYDLADIEPELLRPNPSRGLMNLFTDWKSSEAKLMALANRIQTAPTGWIDPPNDYDFMAPLLYPSKLLLGGANYYEHMRTEANIPDFSKENAMPVFFTKPPSTSLVGCGPVRYPSQSTMFDWEIELAAIVGVHLRRATVEEAAAAIAGYTVGIDFSARDLQFNPKHPFKFDLFTGKAFDDSCPIGPKFVPACFIDPSNLQLRLRVNVTLKQNANTNDMVWSPAEQLAALSQHVTLEPGDILLTGTPAGVGMARGTYLNVGDTIEAEIEGLGVLKVEIVSDTNLRSTQSGS